MVFFEHQWAGLRAAPTETAGTRSAIVQNGEDGASESGTPTPAREGRLRENYGRYSICGGAPDFSAEEFGVAASG